MQYTTKEIDLLEEDFSNMIGQDNEIVQHTLVKILTYELMGGLMTHDGCLIYQDHIPEKYERMEFPELVKILKQRPYLVPLICESLKEEFEHIVKHEVDPRQNETP